MEKTNDSIIFEYRTELCSIINALDRYLQDHPYGDEVDDVRRLLSLLDVMDMSW